MTGCCLDLVLRTPDLCCQIFCSGISVGSSSVLKTGSSGAMPVDSMLTSIGLRVLSFRVFRTIFSPIGSASILDRKSATVFIFPGMCAITKLNCNTKIHAFQSGSSMIWVWKKPCD